MPHSPDFEEEVTHADQDMDLKDEMELQIALADPRLVDDDVLEKAGFKPEEIKVWQEERDDGLPTTASYRAVREDNVTHTFALAFL